MISIEDKRFYSNSGVDVRGDRARLLPGRAPQRQRPGRLDDRAAVHQERAPGPVAPHDLREAQGGRARLPARAQVVQGEDHHGLPEHDLLRQRRLRHRGRRPDLLRPRRQPRRLRHCPATRCASNSSSPGRRRCWPASSRTRAPTTPRTSPKRAPSAATPCSRRCSNRATSRDPSTTKASARRCPPRKRSRRPRSRPSKASTRATSRAGSSSRSIERYGAYARLRRRPEDPHDARPRPAARGRTGGRTTTSPTPEGRPPRSWRSKTRPARCARWSAGATTTRARSTSPPRASASRAPRSRRSTSPPRSRTASRRNRCGRPSRRTSSSPTRAARKSSSCTTTKAPTRARTRSPARRPSPTTRSTPKSG